MVVISCTKRSRTFSYDRSFETYLETGPAGSEALFRHTSSGLHEKPGMIFGVRPQWVGTAGSALEGRAGVRDVAEFRWAY